MIIYFNYFPTHKQNHIVVRSFCTSQKRPIGRVDLSKYIIILDLPLIVKTLHPDFINMPKIHLSIKGRYTVITNVLTQKSNYSVMMNNLNGKKKNFIEGPEYS